MKRCLFLCLATWFLLTEQAGAQTTTGWQEFVDAVSDDEYAEQQGWTENMEELAELAAHPLDINTATPEQLRLIPFLSDAQIEDIQAYMLLHRGMRSLSELMAIRSIDYRTRRMLSVFLYVGDNVFQRTDTMTLKYLLRHSRHELSTRLDIPLYYRLGYSYPPRKGGYKGNPLYNNVRYRLDAQNRFDLGISAEKDQGEPFRNNGGWDSYGFYLTLRNMGILRTAVAGDYKLGFGEGLVMNTGFSMGKSSLMRRPAQGIRAKRGMDEVNYFRGAATTLRIRRTELTTWLSFRKLDATPDADDHIRTIVTDGLHRTNAELDKKGYLGSTMAGGNLSWTNKGWHAGMTGYYQHFQYRLAPGNALYRAIYPQGKDFGVAGINYGYSHLWFSASGETAYSTERGGWSTLERASWKISPQYTLSASYRFYSYKYYSFYASALSENSDVQNESGATLRLDANPGNVLMLTLYADFFHNPWPRYTLTHSSSGQEFTFIAQYPFRKVNTLALRYQLKNKERSDQMQQHNRLRLTYTRQQGSRWTLQSMLNLHSMNGSGTGYALSQRIRYNARQWHVASMLSYFRTPDYDTRLFVYEPTLTNTFRFPSLYGNGLRFVATVRHAVLQKRLSIEALYGMTRYLDRQTQSSGMQEIRSPWKQDVSIQLTFRI